MYIQRHILQLSWIALAIISAAHAADWPTYLCNNQRNAVTEEHLALPLSPAWIHVARHAPQPAWPPPAKHDFYNHGQDVLAFRMDFDHAYHVAVAGNALFYGSSADHTVYCVDINTGEVRWAFFCEGPVRCAPTVFQDKIYFGSDDGWVYCLNASNGELVWKYKPAMAEDCRLPGNGHLISLLPVRVGVIVEGDAVYACAGLFPDHGAYAFALDAKTGKELWKTPLGLPAQGYLVAQGGTLWIPSGRTGLTAISLKDGKRIAQTETAGTYVVAAQNRLFCESSQVQRQLLIKDVAVYPAHFVTVAGEHAYFHGATEISALKLEPYVQVNLELNKLRERHKQLSEDFKKIDKNGAEKLGLAKKEIEAVQKTIAETEDKIKGTYLWKQKTKPPAAFIQAGDTLFCGREGGVAAARANDGVEIWTSEVEGRACGLAVAQGKLFVSTDKGKIYCFKPGVAAEKREVKFADNPAPYPQDALTPVYAKAAEELVAKLPAKTGYALILNCGAGRLACEIAKRTELKIVGVEPDENKAGMARETLAKAGLLGRVTVHRGSLEKLRYPKYFANLIVADDPAHHERPAEGGQDARRTATLPEVLRLLRPFGGVAVIGGGPAVKAEIDKALQPADGCKVSGGPAAWIINRGPLPGAGEWTHQYANPANTASSGDAWVRGKMEPLWFGDPGPREMIDRHNRTMAPLVKDGRIFAPGNERVIAVDAYNGAALWDVPVPGSRRVGVLKDAAHMAVSDNYVYIVAGDKCLSLSVRTGEQGRVFQAPTSPAGEKRDWGYLATAGSQVFGTAQKPGASFNTHCNMCPILEGDFRLVVLSDSLFSFNSETGEKLWEHPGALLNSAIALGDGRIYFLESRGAVPTQKGEDGRVRVDKFLSNTVFLAALDVKTGRKLWETPVKLPFQHIIYLCYIPAEGNVLATGTFNGAKVVYGLRAFRADTGAPQWEQDITTGMKTGGAHGEQWQHPVILDNEGFAKYYGCDLRTGEPVAGGFSEGGGCGTLSGSASALFGRNGNPIMRDLNTDAQTIKLNRVSRPGCFINIIPACGIVAVPEASAGCTCGYPLQASFAYVPSEGLRARIEPFSRKFYDKITVALGPTLEGISIRYTQDGSEPTENSPLYVKPFELSGATTVKARLFGAGKDGEAVAAAAFTKLPRPAPSVEPNGGAFDESVTIQLSSVVKTDEIRYTLDGSEPAATSALYKGPFTLTKAATVKAGVFVEGKSAVASVTFEITGPIVSSPVKGAKVVRWTSQYDNGAWAAANIIADKIPSTQGWASAQGVVFPQELVIQLRPGGPCKIVRVNVNPATVEGKEHWAKEVSIFCGDDANGPWKPLGDMTLEDQDKYHVLNFDPVDATHVLVRVKSNRGGQFAELGKVSVIGAK